MPTSNGIQAEDGGYGIPPRNPPDPNPGESFYHAAYPNQLTFYDGEGKEHKICIKNRYEEALQLFKDEDWARLRERFAAWTGSPEQHYQPEDYEKVPKDRARI